jgi:pyruvate,water dikinase
VNKIGRITVDNELVQSVIDKIVLNKWSSVIFRSSTNAEDLEGFNGAGLYESVPLIGEEATNTEKVAHALKTVWASVWCPK